MSIIAENLEKDIVVRMQTQKHLKKTEILEMLISVSEENEALKSEISELRKKLADREIRIQKAGSIADAAIEINNVFQSAQAAAEQYLINIERLNANAEIEAQKFMQSTREECLRMKEEVRREVMNDLFPTLLLEEDE